MRSLEAAGRVVNEAAAFQGTPAVTHHLQTAGGSNRLPSFPNRDAIRGTTQARVACPRVPPDSRGSPEWQHGLNSAGAVQQREPALDLDQLMGRYLRLKRELSAAYLARPWNSAQIDRLVEQIADAERQIATKTGRAGPFGESVPGFVRQSGGEE